MQKHVKLFSILFFCTVFFKISAQVNTSKKSETPHGYKMPDDFAKALVVFIKTGEDQNLSQCSDSLFWNAMLKCIREGNNEQKIVMDSLYQTGYKNFYNNVYTDHFSFLQREVLYVQIDTSNIIIDSIRLTPISDSSCGNISKYKMLIYLCSKGKVYTIDSGIAFFDDRWYVFAPTLWMRSVSAPTSTSHDK